MSAPDSLEQQSWAFALRIYAEPGVAEACLRLQNEAGVDVILLLMVAFAGSRGISLSPSDIRQMDEACRSWRERVVQPLRALRVMLKTGPSPAPGPATERLRSQIKASELQAERLANDMLASWLTQRAGAPRRVTDEECRGALRDVVVLALPAPHHGRIGELAPAIGIIAAAIPRVA
jgi:uncharacterized protein (TIGR02444 family)